MDGYAERLSLQFQGQSQHEYFGGGTTVSIGGVAVEYLKELKDDGGKQMEFYTFISNGKQKDSAVVFNHFQKLLKYLKDEGVIAKRSTILCNIDAECAQQYRCDSAFYILHAL